MVDTETAGTITKFFLDPLSKAATTEITKYLFTNITEKIKRVYTKNKINVDSYVELAEKFSNYLEKSYSEYSSIPTLALKEKRVLLKDIYQPLTLKEYGSIEDEKTEYIPLKYDDSFFEEHSRLVIFDNAGMGKSTFLKFLFLSAMQQKIQIPIFIELRHLKNNNSILDEIYKKINYLSDEFNKENILELIKDGDFLFFLDGYDEISRSDREKVSSDLKKFLTHANKNRFIITSRPDAGLNLASFEKYEIKNLIPEEAFSIIRKYDGITGYNLQEELIKTIRNSKKHFSSFLENPMFVSLLYVTYKNKRELPLTQGSFYRTVYDALYSDHDFTKDDDFKRDRGSDLSRDELEYFFKKFAYYCFTKDVSDFEYDPLLNIIREVLTDNYFTNKKQAHDIFVDITQNVPLITRDGISYKWIHKSFMEYFTSQYISTHARKKDFLKALLNKELTGYENILKIYVDVDRSTFDSVFLEPLLSSFIEHVEREPQTEQIKKIRSLTFSKKVIMTKINEEHVRELLKSAEDEYQTDHSDADKHFKTKVLFDYLRNNMLEKYNFGITGMKIVPNDKISVNELSADACIVGMGKYYSNRDENNNMNILIRILKEKNYPFIYNHFEISKKGATEKTIISETSFFNNLNNKVGNDLLFDKNTLFKDLDLNLEELCSFMNSIRMFINILDYDEGKRYLEQMRKQDEEDFQLWN
ncbi:NACHT domain-containing protein [Peribacillus butanolivorans]|uniref:NACHT domain-containing protein n=1 Tax=Peribacillus butanolivorans TaxID=421767 RepID=UPI0037FDB973